MQRRSALDNSGVPAPLRKATPREVRVNTSGGLMYITAIALVVAGVWGSLILSRRAESAGRHISLFASERIATGGDVIRLRRRGGDDDNRVTAHYRYTVQGRELTGQTTLRRDERERFTIGSPVSVWYLSSEPEQSWLDGYAPRGAAGWPAAVVLIACGITAVTLIQLVRRQSTLLTYGRPTMATVTKVEKKKDDHGTTFSMVHYKWTTLSGAMRTGKYRHGKKEVPAAGQLIPIVYDRDDSSRHSKYPMSFVAVREERS